MFREVPSIKKSAIPIKSEKDLESEKDLGAGNRNKVLTEVA